MRENGKKWKLATNKIMGLWGLSVFNDFLPLSTVKAAGQLRLCHRVHTFRSWTSWTMKTSPQTLFSINIFLQNFAMKVSPLQLLLVAVIATAATQGAVGKWDKPDFCGQVIPTPILHVFILLPLGGCSFIDKMNHTFPTHGN